LFSRLSGPRRLFLGFLPLKMKTLWCLEMSDTTYPTQCCILEDLNTRHYCCQNLRAHSEQLHNCYCVPKILRVV
jgi:hypothetical protein